MAAVPSQLLHCGAPFQVDVETAMFTEFVHNAIPNDHPVLSVKTRDACMVPT